MYNDEFEDPYYNKIFNYSQKIKQYDLQSLFYEIKNLNKILSSLIEKKDDNFEYYKDDEKMNSKEYYEDDDFYNEFSENKIFEKEFKLIESQLDDSINEALFRVKKDPSLLSYFLKTVPFNNKPSGKHLYDFFILDKVIHNIQDFIILNEAVLENYSKLDNYSYITFFEYCLDKSTFSEITYCADYFFNTQSHLNIKQRDEIILSLIKKSPPLFNNLPDFLKNSDFFKRLILEKNIINNFETFMFTEQLLDKETDAFYDFLSNKKMTNIQYFLTDLIKNYFSKEMNTVDFIIKSSENNKSVAINLSKNIKSDHKIFNSIENINKILNIEALFAHKVPDNFWDNKLNLIKIISSNVNVYHESPDKIKNDLLFCLEIQFFQPNKHLFLDNWKFKKITHNQAVDGINFIIEKNKEINTLSIKLNEEETGWNKRQKLIANYQPKVHFETLCLLINRLDGEAIQNKENSEFRASIWEAFNYLNHFIDSKEKVNPSKDIINPLFLLAYYPKKEMKDNLIRFSSMDILSSLFNSKIPEDKKHYLLDALEEHILEANNNRDSKYSISFILSQFNSEWFNPIEKRASLNDILQVLSIIPSNNLQTVLKAEFLEPYHKRNLLNNFPQLNKNNPLEEILTKILEIQIYNDIQKQPIAPKVKVLKF